jgi:hypothetical protein
MYICRFRITSPSAGLVDVMKEAGGADLRYTYIYFIRFYSKKITYIIICTESKTISSTQL